MNIGIIGSGRIAKRMAETCRKMEGAALTAAAARDFDKTRVFCKEYEIARVYEMYSDLLHDDAVDLVYIAAPHAAHYAIARDALLAGKPVLCEKPFTANARQAEALFLLAEEKRLLITEAIWTRYMPWRDWVQHRIHEGAIGNVTHITADIGYDLMHSARVLAPASAGGALLEVGLYALNFAEMFADSAIADFSSDAVIGETGVDLSETVSLSFANGVTASLSASVCGENARCGTIFGTQGRIVVDNVICGAASPDGGAHVLDETGTETAFWNAYPAGTGLEHELYAVSRALASGETECPEATHANTLARMRTMDALRAAWGVRYPFE